MSTLASRAGHALARTVRFDKHMLHVLLQDGREISVPLEWFPRLRNASDKQRKHWRLIANGVGLHWPEVDEDISVTALLQQ